MSQNVNLDRPWVRGKGILFIKGSFLPNAALAPVASGHLGGHIASVVWVSTGKWSITLRDTGIRAIEAAIPGLQLNADNVDSGITFGAFTNVGTAQNSLTAPVSFIMRNAPGGAVADIAANANNRISFFLVARRSVLR